MNTLEFMALSWLRFEKNCPVAIFERTPRYGHGRPDVIGITKTRHLAEIEIKRSLSDFRANNFKPHIATRNLKPADSFDDARFPKWYWYLVPHDLAPMVKPLLPHWAGLLRGPSSNEAQLLHSVVPAITNKASERLTTKECVALSKCMANQIYSFAKRLEKKREGDIWRLENCHQSAGEYDI